MTLGERIDDLMRVIHGQKNYSAYPDRKLIAETERALAVLMVQETRIKNIKGNNKKRKYDPAMITNRVDNLHCFTIGLQHAV